MGNLIALALVVLWVLFVACLVMWQLDMVLTILTWALHTKGGEDVSHHRGGPGAGDSERM